MSSSEQQDEELKKQVEKIAESIKEKGRLDQTRLDQTRLEFIFKVAENGSNEGNNESSAVSPIAINQHIREFQEKMKIQGGMSKKDWAFWNTQPVPKLDEVIYTRHLIVLYQTYYRK